ncbi:MAG: tetratricopeptide repeat protein [Desulfurobacteriaceae bacterium]
MTRFILKIEVYLNTGEFSVKESFKKPNIDISQLLKRAEALIKEKEYRKAIEELEKLNVRNVDCYLLLAEAYEAVGQPEKAEAYFEEARFLDTEIRSKEKLRRGVSLASLRNFRAAEKELLESIELNPFDYKPYYELYRLYREVRNYRGMIKALESLITLNPYQPYPYLELSKYYTSRRKFKKSVEVLKRAIDLIPSAALYFELGKVYAEWGKSEEAIEALSNACELDFRNVEYRQKLAEVFVNDERYEEALDVVLGTLELYPEAVYVLQSAAALYDLLGNQELAELYYRKAVAVSSGFVREDSLKLLAEYFIEKERYDQAEEVLKELLQESDNYWVLIDAFADLSLILAEQERYGEIVEIGEKLLSHPEIIEDGEDYSEVAEIVADSAFEAGKFEKAMELYRKVLERTENKKVQKRVSEKLTEIEEIIGLEKMLQGGPQQSSP